MDDATYMALFEFVYTEFVYTTQRQGKALLADLFEAILAPDQRLVADIGPAT